ncbi:MAG: hypothetical protein VR64_21540 [Desulfatitalea sp. BRH_c12]|nr:MAG: hypothetical protein VR64_21540 [Desulfatitalea sp. BRH_c12]
MRTIKITVFSVLVAALVAWGSMAIYYSCDTALLRIPGAVLFPLACAGALLLVRSKKMGALIFTALFAIVILVWNSNLPSNDRSWQPDVARLPHATMQNGKTTIHNVRNIEYRSEADYEVRYYDKVVDVSKLRSIDLFLSDWGFKAIVHTLISFGFDDGSYLCISIETRKEIGESYSSIKGLFRQYELIYVVADERDLVRLRTNYRQGETVYLYRVQGLTSETARLILQDYIQYINNLAAEPQWYNALTGNCTTQIRGHTRPYVGKVIWDWRILANGYIDELAYEVGSLDNSLPFEQLKHNSIINIRALAAGQDPDFSKRIREGLAGMDYQFQE